ncbi:MAG: sulfatase, partial [Verrucomicrobiae bacterium]|nr:sulfatase [Verrucomicrobiae bacterium]
ESLKEAGYTTGYVGKWHLGNAPEFQPEHQGYDFSVVIGGPHLPGKYRVSNRQDIKPKPGQYRTEFEGDLGVRFIEENKDKPFFLMISPFAVHIPLGAMSEKVEKYRKKKGDSDAELPNPVYAAMVEHVDDLVGRIVDTIEAQGLTKETMIMFTSDNGGLYRRYDYQPRIDDAGVTSLAPLKGEKGTLHEGGIRVPLIVKYPPVTDAKAGSTCSEPVISYDFYPTFVGLAGGNLPTYQTEDGRSLMPLLSDPNSRLDRNALYWHYPHFHHDRPASAIRERDWKLIEYIDGTGDVELYNLAEDIGETKNLVSEKAGRVADLRKKLNAWRTDVIARMPIPNPHYDPERAGEWWNMRDGKPVPSADRKPFPPTEKDG